MDEDAFGIRRTTRLLAAVLLWDQTKIVHGVTTEGTNAQRFTKKADR